MQAGPINVLLVEDNPADARLLEEALRESASDVFNLDRVSRLKDAATSISRNIPDIILLDLSLPDASGLETVGRMQAIAPGVPIVVLTGLEDERLALEVVRRGVQDYLVKGQSGSSPMRALRYAIERRRIEASLQASEERFRLLVDGVEDYAIIMLDPDGRVESWNGGAQRIKGYEAAEILGRHFSCFYTPEDAHAGIPEKHLQQAKKEGRCDGEGWLVRKDGSRFWADLTITPLWDDNRTLRGFAQVTRDVTQRKAIESELVRTKEMAETANRAKDHFLAVLSHELRTPLTPVLALIMQLESTGDLPEHVRNDLTTIRRNVELEAHLINDLLDLTRIARNKVELHCEVVDVHVVARHALELFRSDMVGKSLTASMQLDAAHHHVWADAGRLQQILANLVSNAIKFTPGGGQIMVRTSDSGPDRICICVEDTGIGIEPDVLARLFSAFEQGERTVTRQYGGLGLGLSIAKSLVELHKGTIVASSAGKGQGATLRIELATVSASQTPRPAASALPGIQGCRVLLVEDHLDTARVMARLLSGCGCVVKMAHTVKDALDFAARETFDLLVSDIGLPDGSGLDVMREVKKHHDLKGIALSGFGLDEDIQRSRSAGFETHLTKPVDLRVLLDAIERIASR